MVSKALYLVTVIALYVLAIIVKKKDEKKDIIPTIFVGIILLACYNVFASFVLKIFNIKIELIALSIINIITLIPFIYKVIKDKELQKYFINVKDIIAIVIITIIGLVVVYINFGIPMNISFVEEDISNHYDMVTDFYNDGNIKVGDICGAYINYGIFFKLFFNPLNSYNGYYLFMICEILKYLFSGILIYIIIKDFSKNKLSYIFGILISIIYMIAYPLHGMLCGFVYLELAINIVAAIFIVMNNYNIIDNEIKNIILFLLLFGLVFSYGLLVLPVVLSIIVYELKTKNENKKKVLLNILKITLIPIVIGILFYFVLPSLVYSKDVYDPVTQANKQLSQVAYSFVSYYSAFIIFLPFCIYNVIINIKKKEIDFFSILFLMNLLYNIAMVIAQCFGKMARYYVMKPYYMLWLVMAATTGKVVLELLSDKIEKYYKILISIVIVFYTLGILLSTLVKGPCDFKIFEYEKEGLQSIFNIYRVNYGLITHKTFEQVYTAKEFEFIKEQTKDFNCETKIVFVEDIMNKEWIKKLLLIKDNNDNTKMAPIDINKQEELINEIKNSDEKIYIICNEDEFVKEFFTEFIQKIDDTFNKIGNEERVTIYTNK